MQEDNYSPGPKHRHGYGPGMGPGAGRGPGKGRGPGPGKRCRFEGRFRERGIKLTVPRRVIINLLDREDEYLSADEIYLRVHEEHPQIGLATVYRTLQLLEDIALIHRLETGDGKSRYKLLDEKDRNERLVFVCGGCGRTTVIDDLSEEEQKALDKMENRGKAEESFRAVRRTVQFYGYCTSCTE
ncbi:MAG: Fur family transcriptional regulator [Sediminispirochaetaceae bacterium]